MKSKDDNASLLCHFVVEFHLHKFYFTGGKYGQQTVLPTTKKIAENSKTTGRAHGYLTESDLLL